jgi:glycine/D-amino acid oxidase-like deaminating enzyme
VNFLRTTSKKVDNTKEVEKTVMNLTTGYPYALINNGLPAHYPKLEQSIKTDVVIIGGGISGALSAYHLINAGIECILVDARTVGLGSTSASTSLLQYELDTPLCELEKQIGYQQASRAYTMCAEAIDGLAAIAKKINFSAFEKKQSLFFAAYKKDKKLMQDEFSIRKKAGFDVQLLNDEQINKHFGFHAPAAILSSKAAATDAYLFTHALLADGIKKGLAVFDRTDILKIGYKKNGATLTTANGHIINAKKIVNATGYEITEFIEKKIITLHSTYALASEHIDSALTVFKKNTLLWNTADPYLYMRSTKDNRIIVGGRDEDFYSPAKRDRLIKKKTALLKNDFMKLFPGFEFNPEFSWTGTFGSTKDSLPYIGTYSKTPHTYYALGFGGNGITFSFIAAQIITDMIKGRKNRDAVLYAFNR